MDTRTLMHQIEAARLELFAALTRQSGGGLRQELDDELKGMEAASVAGGEDPQQARCASWKRVKALHGLGYPVDFGWLHGPIAEGPRMVV